MAAAVGAPRRLRIGRRRQGVGGTLDPHDLYFDLDLDLDLDRIDGDGDGDDLHRDHDTRADGHGGSVQHHGPGQQHRDQPLHCTNEPDPVRQHGRSELLTAGSPTGESGREMRRDCGDSL